MITPVSYSRVKAHLLWLWSRVPGQQTGARLLWLWHLVAAVALVAFLSEARVPEPWTSDVHLAKPHSFNEYMRTGLWRGAWAHLIISMLILVSVRCWSRAPVTRMEVKFTLNTPHYSWFWVVMGLILTVALVARLPRMGLSYWGDEGWALRHYVHGEWVPKQGEDLQGELKFKQVPWSHVLLDDRTGGNHFLFSIAQRLTLDSWRWLLDLPDHAFDEGISRLPPLLCGMFSILALALFLCWLGRPAAGLMSGLYFALHPWHVRYSTEGRGYMLMLLFLILATAMLFWALRSGKWRAWALFGVTQFLAIYSWKVAALPLLEMNMLAAIWLILKATGTWKQRVQAPARLLVTGASMTALFVFLYATPNLQHPRAMERLQHTGKPMDQKWVVNSISGLLLGTPWYRDAPDNPTEVPLSEALANQPVAVGLGIISALVLPALGVRRLLIFAPKHLLMWCAVIAGAIVGAALFKWWLKIEWISWYSFFVILPLAVLWGKGGGWLLALGVERNKHPRTRLCFALALLLPFFADRAALPQIQLMDRQPYESCREAFQATRGKHEPWNFSGPSKVRTCYLWRHIYLYDPRADRYVREAADLRQKIQETEADGGELYYVVGMRNMFREAQKDVMAMLEDPQLFEHTHTLWAEEDIHILEIYRYRRKPPAG
jgi:hypothetical protein